MTTTAPTTTAERWQLRRRQQQYLLYCRLLIRIVGLPSVARSSLKRRLPLWEENAMGLAAALGREFKADRSNIAAVVIATVEIGASLGSIVRDILPWDRPRTHYIQWVEAGRPATVRRPPRAAVADL